jgi:hypothetical protein
VSGDSAFGRPNGYVDPDDAPGLLAVDEPSVGRDSRPIFRTYSIQPRLPLALGDTTTYPVIGVDSVRLSVTVLNRDTATHDNLALAVYSLPLNIDSTTTFTDVAASFSAPPVRVVNVDSLLARGASEDTLVRDPVTGDLLFVGPSRITLAIRLDSAQAPLVPADSGKLAFGIRASANPVVSVSIPSAENRQLGPVVFWFLKVDSLGQTAHRRVAASTARSTNGPQGFDGFVFQPPPAPIGTDLVVGGVPSVRTIMRLAVPRAIRDSARIIVATLELIPTTPPVGIAADSFRVIAKGVIADFGAKSPLNEALTDTTEIFITPVDTIRVNLTNVMISWTLNGTLPTTLFLMQQPEGARFAELRFHSSLDMPYRPRLHVTYAPRYPEVVK